MLIHKKYLKINKVQTKNVFCINNINILSMPKINSLLLKFNFVFAVLLLFMSNPLDAQVGGRSVYEFLDLSPSARISALGESHIAVSDLDITLAAKNPAVLSDTMSGRMSFNHRFYFNGINHGYFSYASALPYQNLNFHGGIQYIRYGDFVAADIFGNKNGTFTANETALILGVSKKVMDRLSVGVNTKWIQSRFESYNSLGFAADLGLLYSFPEKQTNLAFVIRNLGTQITAYDASREPLAFDIQMGISQRLKYLPFRFSIVAHNLHRWNILYDDPNEEDNVIFIDTDQEAGKIGVFTDNLFRHLIFNGEFLIGKSETFSLRFAYNHLRRRELTVSNYISLAGFSFGAGIKFGHFHLDYAYNVYHLAGGSSHIGLSMDVNRLFKKI